MSNQGFYGGQQDHQALPQSNPWADQQSTQPPQYQQQPQQLQQPLQPQQGQYQGQAQPQSQYGYDAPPPGLPPRRTDTFNEGSFVPEAERGEQREAMEQFEMARSHPESQTDRDVAALQQQFPDIDGSLIAALYSDAQNMGATREMLQELDAQAKQQQLQQH